MNEAAPGTVVARSASTSVPLRYIRGTMLASSLAELRTRGLFDRYACELDAAAEAVLLGPLTATWYPVSLGLAHFAACQAVATPELAFEMGKASGMRVQASVVGPLVRLAATAGATPWTVLAHYSRMWARVYDGGSATVTKTGPKDATIHFEGFAFSRFQYYRDAFRGTHDGVLRLFVNQVYVREVTAFTSMSTHRYALSWA